MSTALQFEKDTQRKIVHLADGDNIANAMDFAAILQTYTCAAIEKVVVSIPQYRTGTTFPGDFGLELYAKILMRDLDDLKLYGLIIPDPISSMFEDFEGDLVVKQAVGEALTVHYANYSGRNLEFESGALCGKKE